MQAVRLLGTMRAENAALREQALNRSRKLATVRFCVLLSQQYLNDHSSQRQPVASETDVRNQWTQMMADLTAYRSAMTAMPPGSGNSGRWCRSTG